jgi:hypothetical protein
LALSGQRARVAANLAALQTLAGIRADGRPAAEAEQQVLGRWSGWGAVSAIFDEARTE